MTKDELSLQIAHYLKHLEFRRKSTSWYQDTGQLLRVINLQRSQFGNYCYINYGYIIKDLETKGLYMHISHRLGSIDKEENRKIEETLDLDNNLKDEARKQRVSELLDNIVNTLSRINTTDDLLRHLKKRPHMNDIQIIVKEYFNLL